MNLFTITSNMFQTFNFTYVECYAKNNYKGIKMNYWDFGFTKDVNDNKLVLSLSRVVLEVNHNGEYFNVL